MADTDKDQQQPEESHSVFHDLGQHLANAYQEFIDAKKSYGDQNQPQTPDQSLQTAQTPAQPMADNNPMQPSQPQAQPAVQQQPMQPVQQTSPQQQPMVQQTSPNATQGIINPIQAEGNLANATQGVSQDIQNTLGSGVDQQQQMMSDAQDRFQKNMQQDEALSQAYQQGTIKPMSMFSGNTAQNIGTALGLLFSGIGSGITGQKNLALETINNTINRDMEAQKMNQEKEYNAYRMHRENTQDQFSADMAFQREAMVAMNNHVEMMKAKLMGPQAQAAAAQTQLALKGQIIDLNQKQSMWDAMQQQLKNPSQDPASQIRRMQMTGLIQPAQAEQAYKELDRTQNFGTQQTNILDSFDRANKENTIVGRALHLGSQPASVAALQNQIMPYLKDAEGRINETEIKRVDSLIPDPGDGPHKVAEKRQALQDFMNEKASSSMLKGLGINQTQTASQPKKSGMQQVNMTEGQESTSKSGKPMVFRNGQWMYK